MASSILLKFPKNTEVVTKEVDVEEALTRVRRPIDHTRMSLSVMGIYSLPEAWKAKLVSKSAPSAHLTVIILGGPGRKDVRV